MYIQNIYCFLREIIISNKLFHYYFKNYTLFSSSNQFHMISILIWVTSWQTNENKCVWVLRKKYVKMKWNICFQVIEIYSFFLQKYFVMLQKGFCWCHNKVWVFFMKLFFKSNKLKNPIKILFKFIGATNVQPYNIQICFSIFILRVNIWTNKIPTIQYGKNL